MANPTKRTVSTPSLASLLTMNKTERAQLEALPLQQLGCHTKKYNTFLCYSMAVTDPRNIQDFYKALKLKHPTATHVSCAYKLWNSMFKGTDNLDNGNYGGSRQLLQALDYTKK